MANRASTRVVRPDRDRLHIGLYQAGDESAILECIRACFDCRPELERWRHLYFENPAGEPIIVVARDHGEVVGHLGILPRCVRVCGRGALAAHQIDGMTHPRWRRRGLRKAVAEEARRCVVSRGLIATYGVTNEQSTHTVLTHEHRRSLGPLPVLVHPVRPVAAGLAFLGGIGHVTGAAGESDVVDCAAAGLPRDDGRLTRAATEHAAETWKPPCFDDRHTRLFDAAAGIPDIAFVRDAAHLAWRYGVGSAPSPYLQCDLPDTDGELAATALIRAATLGPLRLVFLLEWHWRSGAGAAARRLVRDAVGLARAAGAHAVAALAMPGTVQRAVLQRLAFFPLPASLLPRTSIVSIRVDRIGEPIAPWVDRRRWYLTCGDGLIL